MHGLFELLVVLMLIQDLLFLGGLRYRLYKLVTLRIVVLRLLILISNGNKRLGGVFHGGALNESRSMVVL